MLCKAIITICLGVIDPHQLMSRVILMVTCPESQTFCLIFSVVTRSHHLQSKELSFNFKWKVFFDKTTTLIFDYVSISPRLYKRTFLYAHIYEQLCCACNLCFYFFGKCIGDLQKTCSFLNVVEIYN
jgi:hypothetical protein